MVSIIEPVAVEYVTKLHSANSAVHKIYESELFKSNDTIIDQCISIQRSIAIIFSEIYRQGYIHSNVDAYSNQWVEIMKTEEP